MILPSKKEYYLNIAYEVAKRGTCIRRNYGSVIVQNDQIVGTGYTGAPRGQKNCCDIGTCIRNTKNIPSGERYEECRSCHSEWNAVINAGREKCINGVLYLVGIEMSNDQKISVEPCLICKKIIINAGLCRVVIPDRIINPNEWVI